MTLYNSFLYELPFHDLDYAEFLKTTGAWTYCSSNSLLQSKDLFQNIIESPERENDLHENPYENHIESKYYTIKQTGNIFGK